MDKTLVISLHQMVWLMDSLGRVLLEKHFSISFQRYLVLATLQILEPATQHKLAVCLGYSDGAVSRMLASLHRAGLVMSSQDPAHGRRNVIQLTQEGRDLATASADFLEAKFQRIVARAGIDGLRYHTDTKALHMALKDCKATDTSPTRAKYSNNRGSDEN